MARAKKNYHSKLNKWSKQNAILGGKNLVIVRPHHRWGEDTATGDNDSRTGESISLIS